MHEEVIFNEELGLGGHLMWIRKPKAWVVFAHGSGSSRKSPRNNWVAAKLNQSGYGTFLFDLLTEEEDFIYENRFNLPLLAKRLLNATEWFLQSSFYDQRPLAYFGASTGAGAALLAAADVPSSWPLFTIISRGGRPDLAGHGPLNQVKVPVLLIVGERDEEVIMLNQNAMEYLEVSELKLVKGATHLFEEPGALEEVVRLTESWMEEKLGSFEGEEWNSGQNHYLKTGKTQERNSERR